MNVEIGEHVGNFLEALLHVEDNPVFIVRSIDGRDQSLSVRAVKSVFDLLRRHSQGRGFVSIDNNIGLRIFDLQVAGDADEVRNILHFLFQRLGVMVKRAGLGTGKSELIEALALLSADANGRGILKKNFDARDWSELRPKLLHDVVDRHVPLKKRADETDDRAEHGRMSVAVTRRS